MSFSVKTISIIIAANVKGLEKGMGSANKSLARFSSQAARMGSMLTFGVTAPLAALGKAAVDTFVEFEDGMMKVAVVTGATESEMKKLESTARELGKTTQFTASEFSELQLILGRKGFDPSQIMGMQEAIADLALATGEGLAIAAETVSASINAFNLEATDAASIANTLALAAAKSSIQLNTFSTAFGHAGASANAVGVSVEELSAINEVLTEQMIQNCMLFVMRGEVKPIWEDSNNIQGGCFSYKVTNKSVSNVWKDLCCHMLGDNLAEETHQDNIMGLTISPKTHFCIIKIWMTNCNNQDPQTINYCDGVNADGCLFKKHITK